MRSAPPRRLAPLLLCVGWLACSSQSPAPETGPPLRVVSMNPSLTAMLVALGAGELLVGIDEFSARQHPELAALPRVGGLVSPSLEAVAARQPDLVVLVPSFEQRDFRTHLAELGVDRLELDPLSFDDVLRAIEELGARVGRTSEARARVEAIRLARQTVERQVAGRIRPGVVLVLQREPLFVVGRGSFLDDMLAMAGARNLAAEFADPWPRVSVEWLVAARPDVILDAAPGSEQAEAWWARWPSLPAVVNGRIVSIDARNVTLPGPWLDRALVALADALHAPHPVARLGKAP